MRLIDADAFIEAMKKTESEYENAMTCPSWWSAFNVISEQPTAYDIDKVVEELERIRAKETCNKEKCDTKEICRICVVDDAIEIVKHGGVSDDVCEWKSESDGELIRNPHTNGLFSNEQSMQNVYCNTCGKKIKVVVE